MARRNYTYRVNDPSGTVLAGGCLSVILFIVVFLTIVTGIIMLAWNLFVPTVLGGPHIGWPEAFGLAILIQVIRGMFSRN